MQTIIFLLMAVLHGIAFFLMTRLFIQNRKSYTLLAVLASFGLFYDNLIVGIGTFIGEGALLENLNAFRFYGHALLTPLLIIFAYGVMRQLTGKYSRIWHSIFCILAVVMIGMGIMADVFNLSLVPMAENGSLRYVNELSEGPPIPSIITIIVMIVVGLIVWRRVGWMWLAIASIIMFVMAAAGASNVTLTNIGEVIFVAGIIATDYHIHNRTPQNIASEPEMVTA